MFLPTPNRRMPFSGTNANLTFPKSQGAAPPRRPSAAIVGAVGKSRDRRIGRRREAREGPCQQSTGGGHQPTTRSLDEVTSSYHGCVGKYRNVLIYRAFGRPKVSPASLCPIRCHSTLRKWSPVRENLTLRLCGKRGAQDELVRASGSCWSTDTRRRGCLCGKRSVCAIATYQAAATGGPKCITESPRIS